MRLFYAVGLEDSVRERAASIIKSLAATGADYKWVETENLHLTLAFLGETPEGRLPALNRILRETAARSVLFSLSFDRIGAFDSLEHPRVLWLGVAAPSAPMTQLAETLLGALRGENLLTEGPPPRLFETHLTLARRRSAKNQESLRRAILELPPIKLESRVDRLLLVRSRLSSKGPVYENLAEAELPG